MNIEQLKPGMKIVGAGFFSESKATIVRVGELRTILAGRKIGKRFVMIEISYHPNATHSFAIDEDEVAAVRETD